MTLKERLQQAVTWQQMAIFIAVVSASITALFGQINRVDDRVNDQYKDQYDVLLVISKTSAETSTIIGEIKPKVDRMYESYLRQGLVSSEVIVNNHNQ
jgi:hypothetical protein